MALSHSFDFFLNDTATTEIYTLSLHDALPISSSPTPSPSSSCPNRRPLTCSGAAASRPTNGTTSPPPTGNGTNVVAFGGVDRDRKSTRLNSSHGYISYAVFCLKKKTVQLLSLR